MLLKKDTRVNIFRSSVECSADHRRLGQLRFRADPALGADALQAHPVLNPPHPSHDFGGIRPHDARVVLRRHQNGGGRE